MKFFKTIIKNMKLLFRSKGNALMVLLGPLIIILLVGLAFNNTSSYELSIGTYSKEYSELTNRYVATLENSSYNVIKFESIDDCMHKIKDGSIHTCIAFPDDFVIENEKDLEIVFYVDYSRLNLVYLVIGALSSGVESESTELTVQYTTVLLNKIDSTKTSLNSMIKDVISLEESNTANADNVETIKKSLNSIDLDSKQANISNVRAQVEDLYESAANIQEKGLDAVDEGYLFIEDATGIVNASIINSFRNNLGDINDSLYDLLNATEDDMDKIIQTLNTASKSIEDMEKKLTNAKAKKADISVNLDSLKKKISEMSTDIMNLKTKSEEIIDDLNSIEITSASKIAKPVNSRIQPVIAENTKLSYLFPSFLMLVIMFIGILLSSTLVITEKKSKAFFRVNSTPTSDSLFIFSTMFTSFIIMIVQTIVILACAFYFLKTPVFDNYLLSLVIVLLGILLFSLLGMLIGFVFSTQEATAMVSITLSCIFLFLSNLVLPLESMSQLLQKIARFNPYVVLSDLGRKSFLFKGTFGQLQMTLMYIGIACILLLILVYLGQKFSKMRYFNRIPHLNRKIDILNSDEDHKKEQQAAFAVGSHKISNEADLLKLLEEMPDNEFYKFLEEHRMELVDWAKMRAHNKRLARKIKSTRSKEKLVKHLQKKHKEKTADKNKK